jgi:4-amino-4-deoxy-L-arabinose transferase-like glycosyltransferase
VYEDEPWQASTGWKLAQDGRFASDLFAGLNRMDERYYGYMPVHPLLLAAVFKGAGVGLFQARFEAVSLGALVLALTYSLARRLFRQTQIGVLALLLLLTIRLTGQTPSQISGIVLLDVARIARYDIAVPVFGLLALHGYLRARARPTVLAYFVTGMAAGLAGLAHLYGLFWAPALLILIWWDGRGQQPAVRRWPFTFALLLGALLPWLPYALYVAADLESWRAQTAIYGDRFQLLDPGWYASNLRREVQRYGPGLPPAGPALLFRPGFWLAWTVLSLSLIALWRRAFQGERQARVLAVPAALFPLLFALLISLKLSNYLVAMVPLWSMAAAWGSFTLWQRASTSRHGRWGRIALLLLLLAVSAEGASRLLLVERTARTTTPYEIFSSRLRSHLPAGGRVLGLHHYWFGLEDPDYRSFAVPIIWSRPLDGSTALPFDAGLDRVNPDAVLVDPRLRGFFEADPGARRQFEAWLARQNAVQTAIIDDPTYGRMEIWLIPAEAGSP